jgi:hypothetical protein
MLRRPFRLLPPTRVAIVLGVLLAALASGTARGATAIQVHGLSPYPNPGACHGADQSGTLFVNSEVEPWLGDNDNPALTADPDSLIGTWQQDRFSSGGSSGLLVGYSHDGGTSWTVPPLADQPAITNCQDPDNSGTNSDWERATDPWSDISPNGDMWFMSLSFNDTRNLRNAMLVSKSEDGGAHWTEPVTLIDDANPHVFNDKNSLTSDPNDSNLVYAVWDRLVFPNERTQGQAFEHAFAFTGPTYFSKTENGTDDDGGDWTTRKILDLGRNDQTIANQIAVLPREEGVTESTLINVFDWIHNDNKHGRKGEKISAMWSTDSGDTWSDPVVIDPIAAAVVRDTDPDGAPCPEMLGHKFDPYICRLRTGDGIPDIAVDPRDGTAYVVWQDGGPEGKVQIQLAKSTDHGQTWTNLGVVNTVGSTDAHTPSVEINADGTVAVTYYDFRFNDINSTDGLETAHWIRRSTDGGASFGPDELLGTTFDTRKAPYALGYFLGDYDGLGSVGTTFTPFWTSTQGSTAGKPVLDGGVDTADRTNVFAALVP